MFVCFWQSRTLLSRRLNSFSISCLILNLFDWRRLLTIYSLSTKNPIETNIWHQLHFVLKTFIVLKIISIYVYMYKYIIWHSYITWLFHSSEEVGYIALVFSAWQWSSGTWVVSNRFMEKTRVLQPISYFHTRPEVLLQHKREPREYSRRYCRPSQHTLYPPSSGAETYNKDLVVMDCLEFSDPCVRVVLSTSKRSKVLSAPQVSVKKIL